MKRIYLILSLICFSHAAIAEKKEVSRHPASLVAEMKKSKAVDRNKKKKEHYVEQQFNQVIESPVRVLSDL